MNTPQAVSPPSRPASGSQPLPVGREGDGLSEAVARDGFAFLPASRALPMFRVPGHGGWGAFADSWNRLELDGHMADGGRYRRRRHATFSIVAPPTQEGIHRDGVDYAFMLLVGRDVLVVTFRRKAA